MIMSFRVTLLRAALQASLLICMLAWTHVSLAANCTHPKAPESIPNGKTAAEAVMVTAMTEFKQYNADVTAYLACLDVDTSDKIREASGATATIMQIKSMQSKKHNSAVDELQALATKFNEQVRAFKARK
jgi:hypothetical protein